MLPTAFRSALTGIHASTIVPMRADFSVDAHALAEHIAWVSQHPGIRGLLVNGHAGENFVLDRLEKQRVVEIARDASPSGCLIVSGVNSESSLEAAAEAAALEKAGADGLLVFPPNSWALGHCDDAVFTHHQKIAEATSIPLLLYGAPVGAGAMAYPPRVLERLISDDRIVGIKEGSWEVATYEANLRLLHSARPDFVVLGSGDEHLLTSYIIGSAGSQVSLAAVAPSLVVDLWDAASSGDWPRARSAHERLYALAVAIYRTPPAGRATARLKATLNLLGKLSCDAVRPPQPSASTQEYQEIEAALYSAGMLTRSATRDPSSLSA